MIGVGEKRREKDKAGRDSGRLLCDSFRRIIATVLTGGKGLFREAGPR